MLNTYFTGEAPEKTNAEKGRYYVVYDFIGTINGKHLQTFADGTKNKFFEITAEDMEKIQNALKSGRKQKT